MVRVPNRGSFRFLNLIIHYVNGEIFGTEKMWSVFRDGPLCEAVRYRVSTVHYRLIFGMLLGLDIFIHLEVKIKLCVKKQI